ncbi:MAG TPA: DUF5655 domain-containing protein, partial [Solirubrobacteraceae bacterium]
MGADPFGDLWTCPRCGRRFASRNQSHTCGRWTLAHHLDGRSPEIVEIVERVIAMARAIGPVDVIPEKTRIALAARMSFAALAVRARWVDGHVVLARRRADPRFTKIETMSPRSHVHHFRLRTPDEVDDVVASSL